MTNRVLVNLLVASPKGTFVGDVASLTLSARRYDPRISGFIFNGIVVEADDWDDVGTLLTRYHLRSKAEEEKAGMPLGGDEKRRRT